ncbi:hypothetical protein CFP56_007846 [Quercus suber]|uniref:DC1 domain-containing protein n=1 Tax=Quercus suber TaxID=58331 RepID=A0AAW0L4A9_QUESU
MELQHFCHPKHPLIFNEEKIYDKYCYGCQEPILDSSYSCIKCEDYKFYHHKSCAELPLMFHHPLHPIHPLILINESTRHPEKEISRCDLCKDYCGEYSYHCYRCNFNLHIRCIVVQLKANFHDHPLTPIGKSIIFTCDICGKEDKNVANLCAPCSLWIHRKCGRFPHKVKVVPTEIEHFSHEHDLKLTNEVLNNKKCNGCVRDILPPFYNCAKCNFFLHKSCVELPKKKRHPLHRHPLTLLPMASNKRKFFWCYACKRFCNGFTYLCETCDFKLDVPCSLVPEILTHPGHEHRLFLSSIPSDQNCNCCDSKVFPIFRCTICEFALDFKCATLPHSTRYKQHEHPFTLCYTTEDDSGEYYCDICEEERDPKHWFYYCVDCSYPTHPKCILGIYPNVKLHK